MLLKNDFNAKADSIKRSHQNKSMHDAPFLRVTHINDLSGKGTCSSFIIAYAPEFIRKTTQI